MTIQARLIEQLDAAREAMQEAAEAVDPSAEIYPGWTIKEILAHITGWEDATIESLRAHALGDVPATPASRGIDAYNASTVATRETLSYDHVVREWRQTRQNLKDLVRGMDPDRLTASMVFPWGPRGTVEELVRIMVHHENGHAQEVIRWQKLSSLSDGRE
ncbi:MAG: DinB family protein [Anaerolineae bacterium]|jgi:uncharacterized protein (TIGR03083 family)